MLAARPAPSRPHRASFAVVFIAEMTARAFIVADSNKRRTLSRSDISRAIAKSDQFDFLIDILPREDPIPTMPPHGAAAGSSSKRGKKREEEVGGLVRLRSLRSVVTRALLSDQGAARGSA